MEKKLKITAIVQARLNSTRLPGKVLLKIKLKSILEIIQARLKESKYVNKIIFAIPKNDKLLKNFLKKKKFNYFLGSNENVLQRYYECAKKNKSNIIVRITADCPLIDSGIIDNMIKIFKKNKLDLITNYFPPSFPDGLDVSIFSFKLLKETFLKAKNKYEKEHVVPYMIYKKNIKKYNYSNKENLERLRWTLDEKEDYKLINYIFKNFKSFTFSWKKVLKLLKKNSQIFKINSHIPRDEGAILHTGQKLWKRAKNIIPGGNMFLSKNPEFYLKDKWPTYFEKSKNCFIWDLDNNKYLDMSMMGVGTNVLGYNNNAVDNAVKKILKLGNMTTLNCKEEVVLAEKLISIHPWAGMCKFTRTGGEANAVAMRIARAFTKKNKVAVCGYHGWHDWYLAANIKDKNKLNQHLLKNVPTLGVPKELSKTIYTFDYNNFSQLKKLIKRDKEIGIIKMEVARNYMPKNNFLQKIRKLCDQKKIILIFDECTSGFRQTFGGLHKYFNVNPDIAIFGKALGNGYAINAIIGKKNIMDKAKDCFISSSFWSERIGSVAALATIKEMEKKNLGN